MKAILPALAIAVAMTFTSAHGAEQTWIHPDQMNGDRVETQDQATQQDVAAETTAQEALAQPATEEVATPEVQEASITAVPNADVWLSPQQLNPNRSTDLDSQQTDSGNGSQSASSETSPAVTSEQRLKAKIDRVAKEMGVPPALARAVVHVESRFNPRVTGRAGEIGLMQIKLQTARGMGYSGSRQALYDPETNIRYGMKYLAKAYELAGGDLCGTILRYNAGHYARRMSAGPQRYCNRVRQIMGA